MFSAPTMMPYPFGARIQPQADGRFAFARDGEMACVVNVPDDLGYFGDAVAWLPASPTEWWQHERRIPILGVAELLFATDMGCDLSLVETPARFVELGRCWRWPGPTAAIIDWDARDSLRLWFSLVRGVQCETPILARTVEAFLGGVPRRHRLRIEVAEAAKPPAKTVRERVAVRTDANHAEATL